MKNNSIVLFALLFVFAIGSSSCSKSCKGGGWYGDRNLGFAPIKEQPVDNVNPVICEEEIECNISNP